MNVSDTITRGKSISELMKCEAWFTGPEWLKNEENWPKSISVDDFCDEALGMEMRKQEVLFLATVNEDLLDLKRYGSYRKVLRVTAYIRRFIYNCRHDDKRVGSLNADELNEAENYCILNTQEHAFLSEKNTLIKGEELESNSKIKCFNPFLDENKIIRLGGRLQFSSLTEEEKHPILLSNNNEITELLIHENHEKVAHGGLSATLTILRQRFWILKATKVTKSIIKKCLICRKHRAKPFCEVTAPLPADHIMKTSAFEVSAVDFAGLIYIKDKHATQKAYICLFTCATSRAVHLELVLNLSTDTFILDFKRFINRRGMIRIIYSDNASTFKKA
ncbi:uncharacterized protein LOC129218990 [Uloborus diversus]|uniref:uncharacterized protein LOC129218990 n=1 Tax=Uloborus diversus TaxID=327109 RepID=UPI0024090A22|nr:uncharacterized protein LOC129218990 [Uloborus diversus]